MQDQKIENEQAVATTETTDATTNANAVAVQQSPLASDPAEGAANAAVDPLDELADLDFLLEDIEDKIAPLALSAAHGS